MSSIVDTLSLFCDKPRGFLFLLVFTLLQLAFLFYLLIALLIHRSDRKALERIAIEKRVDLFFKYSWRGVCLKISHPTDRDNFDKKKEIPGKKQKNLLASWYERNASLIFFHYSFLLFSSDS